MDKKIYTVYDYYQQRTNGERVKEFATNKSAMNYCQRKSIYYGVRERVVMVVSQEWDFNCEKE